MGHRDGPSRRTLEEVNSDLTEAHSALSSMFGAEIAKEAADRAIRRVAQHIRNELIGLERLSPELLEEVRRLYPELVPQA